MSVRFAKVTILCAYFLACCVVQGLAAEAKRTPARSQQFRWPRKVITKAQSPNRKLVAIYDSTGYYLADASGEHAHKLAISVDWDREDTAVEFSFNRAGTLLAVMLGGWYGEPHIHSAVQLWSVDTRTRKAWKVAQYMDGLLGTNRVVEVGQKLGRWSKDGQSITVVAEVIRVIDGAADTEEMGEKKFLVDMTYHPHRQKTGKR